MAVQVPRIERANVTSGTPKNDRINMNVKDQSSAILNRGQDINQIVGQVDQIHTNYENEKIDQLAYENEKDYTIWTNDQLNKLKSVEGDPTKAYKEFDEAAIKKKDDLLSLYPDVGGRVKDSVSARLNKTHDKNNIGVLKQRGMQQEVYANNLFESTVKLKKNQMSVEAGYIQRGDDSSFQVFNDTVSDLKTSIVKRGMQKGTSEIIPEGVDSTGMSNIHSYKDDDGKIVRVKMTPMDQQRIAKEVSAGVKSSMETLIASGQIEEARMMQEKYKSYIDPKTATSLEKKFKTVGRKAEAFEVIGSLRGKTPDQQLEALDDIQDEELRAESLKFLEAENRRVTLMRDRADKSNRDTILKETDRMMRSGELNGISDLENSPIYKAIDFDKLSAKSQEAIRQAVEQPKISSPDSQKKMADLFANDNEKLETMSDFDFQTEYLTGLSKEDRNKAMKEFGRLKHPSASDERATLRQGDKLLKEQLIFKEHIGDNRYNKIDDDRVLLGIQEKMRDRISNMKVAPSYEVLKKMATEYAAAAVEERVFNPKAIFGDKKQAPRSSQGSSQNTNVSANVLEGKSNRELLELKVEFQKKFKFPPSNKNDPRFLKFVQEKG